MDVLRHIPHDGIGAAPDAGSQHPVDQHAEVLRLIDNDVVGLADHLRFPDPPVQIGQRRQIVHVKFPLRDRNVRSLFPLLRQKLPVHVINGALPHFFPIPPPVCPENGFPLLFRIFDSLPQEFLPDPVFQPLVEHVDLALHGNARIFSDITLHSVPAHQLDGLPGRGRLSARPVKHAGLSVLKAFHELPGIQINASARDRIPLQGPAVGVQRLEPFAGPPLPSVSVRLIGRTDPVFFLIPVLIEEPHHQLLHGHLPHAVHIQIGKHARDVFQQDPVAPHDIEILRLKPLLIVIEDIGDPVHGNRGFPRSRHALHDHVVIRGTADDIVLLLLDRGDDLSQDGLLVFGKIPGQQIVVGHHLGIIKIQQLPVLDLISPLSLQIDLHPAAARHGIAAFSQSVLIIGVGHGRAPVHHRPVGGIL